MRKYPYLTTCRANRFGRTIRLQGGRALSGARVTLCTEYIASRGEPTVKPERKPTIRQAFLLGQLFSFRGRLHVPKRNGSGLWQIRLTTKIFLHAPINLKIQGVSFRRLLYLLQNQLLARKPIFCPPFLVMGLSVGLPG